MLITISELKNNLTKYIKISQSKDGLLHKMETL